jgi:hypothetical protein
MHTMNNYAAIILLVLLITLWLSTLTASAGMVWAG